MLDRSRKVFGIGLSKTGTSSLDSALNTLGIPSIHYPYDPTTYRELASANYHLSVLNKYQGMTDIPAAPFYPQFDVIYPGSKFILTVRDLQSWLNSVENHWKFMREWCKRDQHFRRFTEFISASVYGALEFGRDRFAYVYTKHHIDVLNYFAKRPDDLLVLNAGNGQEWEKLCGFLDCAVPDRPYPHANRREEKGKQVSWIEHLDQAVIEFNMAVPRQALFVLIDENGLAGSQLDIPGRTHRIVEREGRYWGSPNGSAEAIEELEYLRDAGVTHLVVAWHCQWWFDYYEEFGEYVKSRCRQVFLGKQLRIFELLGSPA